MPAPVRIDRPSDGVALVTLDLPEKRNAMTGEMTAAWVDAVARLKGDRSVRAVVVTGSGTAFCSGGDLSFLGAGTSEEVTADLLRDRMTRFYASWLSVRELEVPVLAAVNGPAIGAGLCLALACDLRYAATEARFGAPFALLGLHPGMAATFLLPEAVGLPRAREMLYTGRVLPAEEAAAIGLVNAVLPSSALLPHVLETAARVAVGAPVAVRLTKAALAGAGQRSIEQALAWEALAQPVTMTTQDLQEGLRAQAERRRPVFQGR